MASRGKAGFSAIKQGEEFGICCNFLFRINQHIKFPNKYMHQQYEKDYEGWQTSGYW